MKERLVWLPIYSLSCAAVGIFAFFASHNNLEVGLVTAALGAVFGALGWLAMPRPPRPYRRDVSAELARAEAEVERLRKLLISALRRDDFGA